MPRKKKIESLPFQPCDTTNPTDADNVTDLPPESPAWDSAALLDQALAHYDLHSSDVFVVRNVAPGTIRIITRDAQKFTYPPQEK